MLLSLHSAPIARIFYELRITDNDEFFEKKIVTIYHTRIYYTYTIQNKSATLLLIHFYSNRFRKSINILRLTHSV